MKPAFTFFLLIVFLLTGGNHPAHAGASLVKNQVPGQTSIKENQREVSEINKQTILQSDTSDSQNQKDLLDLVADEDDEQDDISRKSFSQSIGFTAFFYAFISNYTGSNIDCCNHAYELPFYHGSCKYIEHRSLRI